MAATAKRKTPFEETVLFRFSALSGSRVAKGVNKYQECVGLGLSPEAWASYPDFEFQMSGNSGLRGSGRFLEGLGAVNHANPGRHLGLVTEGSNEGQVIYLSQSEYYRRSPLVLHHSKLARKRIIQ